MKGPGFVSFVIVVKWQLHGHLDELLEEYHPGENLHCKASLQDPCLSVFPISFIFSMHSFRFPALHSSDKNNGTLYHDLMLTA